MFAAASNFGHAVFSGAVLVWIVSLLAAALRGSGNVRAPEPRGKDQETLDPVTNPFPGADVVQPPLASGRPLRFH